MAPRRAGKVGFSKVPGGEPPVQPPSCGARCPEKAPFPAAQGRVPAATPGAFGRRTADRVPPGDSRSFAAAQAGGGPLPGGQEDGTWRRRPSRLRAPRARGSGGTAALAHAEAHVRTKGRAAVRPGPDGDLA